MRSLTIATFYLFGALQASVAIGQQNTVLPEYPNSYEIVRNVVELPAGRQMGSGNAIDIDSQGNIWVFERCGGNNGACPVSDVDPVLQFSPEGNLLSSFGRASMIIGSDVNPQTSTQNKPLKTTYEKNTIFVII